MSPVAGCHTTNPLGKLYIRRSMEAFRSNLALRSVARALPEEASGFGIRSLRHQGGGERWISRCTKLAMNLASTGLCVTPRQNNFCASSGSKMAKIGSPLKLILQENLLASWTPKKAISWELVRYRHLRLSLASLTVPSRSRKPANTPAGAGRGCVLNCLRTNKIIILETTVKKLLPVAFAALVTLCLSSFSRPSRTAAKIVCGRLRTPSNEIGILI